MLTSPPMAKKKPKPPDKHASGFMVRLPESYRGPLERMKREHGRPITESVRRALDAYLKANGVDPPPPPA